MTFDEMDKERLARAERMWREFESKYAKQLDENQKIAKRLGEVRHELEELKLSIQPLKDNINALTSERSKFIRKIKRLENKR